MVPAALLIGLFMAAIGVLGVVLPQAVLTSVRYFVTPLGLCLVAAFRVVAGLVLVLAAPSSRFPGFLRILGYIVVVAGLITPFFGVERALRILDWWSVQDPAFVRLWMALGVAFGAFVVYAVSPRRRIL